VLPSHLLLCFVWKKRHICIHFCLFIHFFLTSRGLFCTSVLYVCFVRLFCTSVLYVCFVRLFCVITGSLSAGPFSCVLSHSLQRRMTYLYVHTSLLHIARSLWCINSVFCVCFSLQGPPAVYSPYCPLRQDMMYSCFHTSLLNITRSLWCMNSVLCACVSLHSPPIVISPYLAEKMMYL